MIPLDTRGKRKRHYKHYENKDEMKHQEIETPEWLVDELLSYLDEEDFTKKVLDPCVGPGTFAKRFLNSDLTIIDIQEKHIKNFIQAVNRKPRSIQEGQMIEKRKNEI